MKLQSGFVVRDVAGKTVAISTSPKNSFQGMISLNASAKLLWERLTVGADREELISALMEEYGIDRTVAERDTDALVGTLREHGLLVDQ